MSLSSRFRHPARLAGACSALASAGAQAAEAAASGYSPAGSLLQVVIGLAVVLGVMWAAARLLRRHPSARPGAGGLRIVGGVGVGPRERVTIVEVGNTWIVAGVAPGRVQALHVMERPAGVPHEPAAAPGGSRFAADLLARLQGRS